MAFQMVSGFQSAVGLGWLWKQTLMSYSAASFSRVSMEPSDSVVTP